MDGWMRGLLCSALLRSAVSGGSPSRRSRKMPRRMSALTRAGCFCAYASDSVDPHDPPNTTHRSTLHSSRSFSKSDTRCHVVFSSRHAYGVDLPAPRWSGGRKEVGTEGQWRKQGE